MDFISINKDISTPKYKQIIDSIENAIIEGLLKKEDKIPSINDIKNSYQLSRDTVLFAFNELKNRGIIKSVVGKGYYVASENVTVIQKIFLLFDELNSFKEDLYNSFLKHLGNDVQVDIYFHHFNENIFSKLIQDNQGDYNYFVIMPANLKNTNDDIKKLANDKVYILDQIHDDLTDYPAIYQNFEKALFNNLTKIVNDIKKYQKLVLVFSKEKQPEGILNGFTTFCEANSISFEIINSFDNRAIEKGELYIILDDKNLLRVIKKMKEEKLTLAKDIGVISYNDTLLKEIVEGGITTISTDFNAMGKRLAEMILNKEKTQIENPNNIIIRNSI
ncbi:transcriptional regulator, GntR family [Lutibacter sp. Hel_I_33_5]|uniref:GntR family transcriptional regulator n=1 Tax=Lutibacter sp. Hel_I_33_5 TaxID=1566289 RepID=UPI00119D0D95|nr:GntR family transcriptional regulator [Lutibacter sp. Hel_I_33_5]TVZ55987.1 transcriptional regulator, GntR family [Lutibacter sp. Hel_I_33_5]